MLLAHSIGATVAMVAAANIDEAIPLAGLILHGIGAVGQPTFEDEQNAMGPAIEIGMQTGYVQLPVEQKNNAMLCLSESLGPRDVELRLDCHGKTPIADMFEVRESWFDWWRVVAGTIKVPVLYAIADHDLFWASQPLEVSYDYCSTCSPARLMSFFACRVIQILLRSSQMRSRAAAMSLRSCGGTHHIALSIAIWARRSRHGAAHSLASVR